MPLLYPVASQPAPHSLTWRENQLGPSASGRAGLGKRVLFASGFGLAEGQAWGLTWKPPVGVVSYMGLLSRQSLGGWTGRGRAPGSLAWGRALALPPHPPSHLAQAPQAPAWRHFQRMTPWALTCSL